MKLYYFLRLFTLILGVKAIYPKLEAVMEWSFLDITPIPSAYRTAGNTENDEQNPYERTVEKDSYFNHSKAMLLDFATAADGRTFLTVLARYDVRVSLTKVADLVTSHGALLDPYPDFSWFQDNGNCSQIIAARSIVIDDCNRLWVLDNGRVEGLQVCMPKLLVFDLKTNKLLKNYEIPTVISQNSEFKGLLVNLIVRTSGPTCESVEAYIADSEGYALIFFDGDSFIRLREYSEFEPHYSRQTFEINGQSFNLRAGIAPMALNLFSDHLFFSPLASVDLRAINVTNLISNHNNRIKSDILGISDLLTTQPTAMLWAGDKLSTVLFIGQTDNSIVCWSAYTILERRNLDTAVTDERLQFIGSMKSYRDPFDDGEEHLRILTYPLQKIINKKRNLNEVNFRILDGSVKNLIQNTKCDV